uniref:Coat protein n=1 Tax=Pineapple mealybug wilt-associated virus 1 TaxID=180903 RepID=A0A4D6G0G5_9CLOS|nr:coat protein [Pineapple mealybug wilt-associated virus 1]QJQ80374.1 coat protein [Pineapple mealybug wilt-associated virus 1]
MADLNKQKEKAADEGGSKSVDAQVDEIMNLPVPGGRTTVATFEELIAAENAIIDFTKVDVPRMINVPIPGIVTNAHKLIGSKALWDLGKSKGISESAKHMIQFMMQSFQDMCTFSTSPKVSDALNRTTSAKYDGKEVTVSHEEIRTALGNSLSSLGYDNPMRQFGRAFTSVIVQGLSAGKLVVNTRICTKNGIPRNYYSFYPDCLHVEARVHGDDAALVSELGRMVAINRANTSGTGEHNVFEKTAVSPHIFTGGRK